MASILKSLRLLADPGRLRILLLLAAEELSVAELQATTPTDIPDALNKLPIFMGSSTPADTSPRPRMTMGKPSIRNIERLNYMLASVATIVAALTQTPTVALGIALAGSLTGDPACAWGAGVRTRQGRRQP